MWQSITAHLMPTRNHELALSFYSIQSFSLWMVLSTVWVVLLPLDNSHWKCPGPNQSSQITNPITITLFLIPTWQWLPISHRWKLYMTSPLPLISFPGHIPGVFILPPCPTKVGCTSWCSSLLSRPGYHVIFFLTPTFSVNSSLTILCKVGTPQPAKCLDLLTLLCLLQSTYYHTAGSLLVTMIFISL